MTTTVRLLVHDVRFRQRADKADVLSIRGTHEPMRPGDDAPAFLNEIVLFGPKAHEMNAELTAVLDAARARQRPDDPDWAAAGIRVDARGNLHDTDRGLMPAQWLKADIVNVVTSEPSAPDAITAFRKTVYRAVELAVMAADVHKSGEGDLTVGWTYPPLFHADQRPRAHVHLYAYVLGPGRGKDWYADSLETVMGMVVEDLTRWLREDCGLVNVREALHEGAHPEFDDPEFDDPEFEDPEFDGSD